MIDDRIRKGRNTDENGSEKLECRDGRRNERYRAIGGCWEAEEGGGAAASELPAMYGSTTSRPTLTSSF